MILKYFYEFAESGMQLQKQIKDQRQQALIKAQKKERAEQKAKQSESSPIAAIGQ